MEVLKQNVPMLGYMYRCFFDKEKTKSVVLEITEDNDLWDMLDNARTNIVSDKNDTNETKNEKFPSMHHF